MLLTRKGWELTQTELKVLKYLRDGLVAKEIAEKMGVAECTAKFHIANIYKKFKVDGRIALHKVIGFHQSRTK